MNIQPEFFCSLFAGLCALSARATASYIHDLPLGGLERELVDSELPLFLLSHVMFFLALGELPLYGSLSLVFLMASVWEDHWTGYVYDVVSAAGFTLIVPSLFTEGLFLYGVAVVIALVFFARSGWVGGGDVIPLVHVGILLLSAFGWSSVLLLLFFSSLSAVFLHVVLCRQMEGQVPLMPHVAIGLTFSLLFTKPYLILLTS